MALHSQSSEMVDSFKHPASADIGNINFPMPSDAAMSVRYSVPLFSLTQIKPPR
jgi:hypothetical protein